MRTLCGLLIFLTGVCAARAEEKMKMDFKDESLVKIIENYSKASGQKFVVDSGVRGTVSIFLPEPVSIAEAFNQLSSALAMNGYAISKQGDTMIVKSARNIQRDYIEVSTERPSLKPERLYTWIYSMKHLSVGNINRDLRVLQSRDGELAANESTNQLIFTDWVSTINRIADLLKEVDKPVDAATAKIIQTSLKEKALRENRREDKKTSGGKAEHL